MGIEVKRTCDMCGCDIPNDYGYVDVIRHRNPCLLVYYTDDGRRIFCDACYNKMIEKGAGNGS